MIIRLENLEKLTIFCAVCQSVPLPLLSRPYGYSLASDLGVYTSLHGSWWQQYPGERDGPTRLVALCKCSTEEQGGGTQGHSALVKGMTAVLSMVQTNITRAKDERRNPVLF